MAMMRVLRVLSMECLRTCQAVDVVLVDCEQSPHEVAAKIEKKRRSSITPNPNGHQPPAAKVHQQQSRPAGRPVDTACVIMILHIRRRKSNVSGYRCVRSTVLLQLLKRSLPETMIF
eukprot:jgi/Ulvmu1/11614/UM008_0015.1